jgi:hypothetical protein
MTNEISVFMGHPPLLRNKRWARKVHHDGDEWQALSLEKLEALAVRTHANGSVSYDYVTEMLSTRGQLNSNAMYALLETPALIPVTWMSKYDLGNWEKCTVPIFIHFIGTTYYDEHGIRYNSFIDWNGRAWRERHWRTDAGYGNFDYFACVKA